MITSLITQVTDRIDRENGFSTIHSQNTSPPSTPSDEDLMTIPSLSNITRCKSRTSVSEIPISPDTIYPVPFNIVDNLTILFLCMKVTFWITVVITMSGSSEDSQLSTKKVNRKKNDRFRKMQCRIRMGFYLLHSSAVVRKEFVFWFCIGHFWTHG